jgi:hypothetical protein|tara:strand:- start:374 stop:670 length:297 start_codon:yes stop_codon:yes gene_type:complete
MKKIFAVLLLTVLSISASAENWYEEREGGWWDLDSIKKQGDDVYIIYGSSEPDYNSRSRHAYIRCDKKIVTVAIGEGKTRDVSMPKLIDEACSSWFSW